MGGPKSLISRRGFEFFHKKKGLFLFEILRFALYDKYNRGFGGKAPEDSSNLIIRVFLFRICFFFFHRNKKEKVNISLSVGLAKPTYMFLRYISLFNHSLSPTPTQTSHKTILWIVLLGRVLGEGVLLCLFRFTPHPNLPPRGRNTTFLIEILRFAQYDRTLSRSKKGEE